MKRIALLLAGLAMGMTSPAMADAWAPGRPRMVAMDGLQLAQNDNGRRHASGRNGREERAEPRGQREGPARREAPPQREAGPERDPRYAPDRRDARQSENRQGPDPRDAYDRRGGGRPEMPLPAQGYAPPRLSEQSAIGAVRRQFPGGRLLDSRPVNRNGRTSYSVRVQTRDGRLVDYLVDGMSGEISRGGG